MDKNIFPNGSSVLRPCWRYYKQFKAVSYTGAAVVRPANSRSVNLLVFCRLAFHQRRLMLLTLWLLICLPRKVINIPPTGASVLPQAGHCVY